MDSAGAPTLLNCLMYKMCYYRFGEVQVVLLILTFLIYIMICNVVVNGLNNQAFHLTTNKSCDKNQQITNDYENLL